MDDQRTVPNTDLLRGHDRVLHTFAYRISEGSSLPRLLLSVPAHIIKTRLYPDRTQVHPELFLSVVFQHSAQSPPTLYHTGQWDSRNYDVSKARWGAELKLSTSSLQRMLL